MAKFRNFLAMEFCPKHVVDIKPQRCPFCHIVELEAKLEAAEDGWHLANGTADLAMKHRDLAENSIKRVTKVVEPFLDTESYPSEIEEYGRGYADGRDDIAKEVKTALKDTNQSG